jgi:hypothetical protein
MAAQPVLAITSWPDTDARSAGEEVIGGQNPLPTSTEYVALKNPLWKRATHRFSVSGCGAIWISNAFFYFSTTSPSASAGTRSGSFQLALGRCARSETHHENQTRRRSV